MRCLETGLGRESEKNLRFARLDYDDGWRKTGRPVVALTRSILFAPTLTQTVRGRLQDIIGLQVVSKRAEFYTKLAVISRFLITRGGEGGASGEGLQP